MQISPRSTQQLETHSIYLFGLIIFPCSLCRFAQLNFLLNEISIRDQHTGAAREQQEFSIQPLRGQLKCENKFLSYKWRLGLTIENGIKHENQQEYETIENRSCPQNITSCSGQAAHEQFFLFISPLLTLNN